MNLKEKAVKGVVWSAIQNWGSQAGSLLVFFLLARLLKPEAFGLVALASVFLAFLQIFLNQGFTQVLIQRQDLEPEHLDTAFWTNLTLGILLTGLSFTAADSIAGLFQQPQLAPILQGFSPLFLINSFAGVQQALLERHLSFKAIAMRGLAGTFIGGVVGVVSAMYGFGVWSLVYQQLMQELVGAVVLWRSSNWRPRFLFSFSHFQHLFSFGTSLVGFNFLQFLNTRADDFLIGYFLGPVALGYYTVAYRILGVMQQLLVNTSKQVVLPTFAHLQQDIERFRKTFYTATQLTSLIAFPIFFGVIILAPELIVLLFGKQWVSSIPVLQVLSFAGIFQSISFFKSSVFIALGKPAWALWLALLSTSLNLIGFAIAIRWGIVAVALAFVVRGYLVFPIGQWAISRLIQVPMMTYLQQFISPLSSAVTMAIAIFVAKQLLEGWASLPVLLAVYIVVGVITYGLMIRLLSPALSKKVLELFQSVVTSSKRQDLSNENQ